MLLSDWLSSRHFVIDMKQLYIQKKVYTTIPHPFTESEVSKQAKKKT